MENKNVGYLLLGISIIVIFIIFLFNNAMKAIVVDSCGPVHGPTCEMNKTIEQQTYLSLAIVAILLIVGLVLTFTKPKERIIIRKLKEKPAKLKADLSSLRREDKILFEIIQKNGPLFQAELSEKTGFGKAKISRALDRLENRGLIERKRRGMTNLVALNHSNLPNKV